MAKLKKVIRLSERLFLQSVTDFQGKERYCFILGAGASKTSGIPMGTEMMKEWRKYLMTLEEEELCTCALKGGIAQGTWEHIFQPDYKMKNGDYFTLYDMRYSLNWAAGYHYLQEKMEGKTPSLGYFHLAAILDSTPNNLVITTNFDSLVEDALFLYQSKRPVVAGHESLASFIHTNENYGRPLIAKVHRGLMYRPLNRNSELNRPGGSWEEGWKESLKKAFQSYIPIVIGYAGGDQTLMRLLKESGLHTVYWCMMPDEKRPEIEEFLRSLPDGHLIRIKGFDPLMAALYQGMCKREENKAPKTRVEGFLREVLSKLDEKPATPPKQKETAPPAPEPAPKSEPEPAPKPESAPVPEPAPAARKRPRSTLDKERLQNATFGGQIAKDTVTRIVFLDTLETVLDRAKDWSEEQDGGVMAWRQGSTLFLAGDGGVAAPKSCYELFKNWSKLETITNGSLFDTGKVTDMGWMFYGCFGLTDLDVSGWDTAQVTNMRKMFYGCSSLTDLDVSGWDTAQVTDMGGMFDGCSFLTGLDVSGWKTAQVTDMRWMFHYCSSLTGLDVSGWRTAQVTNMGSMFKRCSSLKSLDVSRWNTAQVTDMGWMFDGCSSLRTLRGIERWNTSSLITRASMFNGTQWRYNPPI